MSSLHYLDPNPKGRPAILLLHGLGANAISWTLQLPPLIHAGFRPIAADAPGFGESPYDGKGWSISRAAGAMAGLLEELKTGPVHVVGLSMGGVIALQFALDFPSLARSLVLVNTFAVLRPRTPGGWLYFALRFVLVHVVGLPAQARFVARRIFPLPEQETLRQMLVASVLQSDARAYRAAMRALALYNSKNRLGEIKAPTLVVTGESDTTVPLNSQKALARGIPGAKHMLIPNAGHAASVDNAGAFNRELLAFLSG